MGIGDVIWCIFLPPLASGVRAKGCGMMLLVLLLTCLAWLPGTAMAIYLQLKHNELEYHKRHVIVYHQGPPPPQE